MFHPMLIRVTVRFKDQTPSDTIGVIHDTICNVLHQPISTSSIHGPNKDGVTTITAEGYGDDSLIIEEINAAICKRAKGWMTLDLDTEVNPHLTFGREVIAMPGYYYYPADTRGLKELELHERVEILRKVTGNIMYVIPDKVLQPGEWGDLQCALANKLIPTHRQ